MEGIRCQTKHYWQSQRWPLIDLLLDYTCGCDTVDRDLGGLPSEGLGHPGMASKKEDLAGPAHFQYCARCRFRPDGIEVHEDIIHEDGKGFETARLGRDIAKSDGEVELLHGTTREVLGVLGTALGVDDLNRVFAWRGKYPLVSTSRDDLEVLSGLMNNLGLVRLCVAFFGSRYQVIRHGITRPVPRLNGNVFEETLLLGT